MVVIQAREWIGLLPGERFGRAQRTHRVARGAVGRVELLAGDGSRAQAGEQAALGVGQIVCGGVKLIRSVK